VPGRCHYAGVAVISKRVISRILAGTLFIIGGGCFALILLLAAPNFWYVPCAFALVALGFVWWFCRPALAGALSVGPLVAVAAFARYPSGKWLAISAACLIAAVIFVVLGLHNGRGWKLPLFISIAYLTEAFCTD
jgi:hypothetical protein